MEKRISVLDWIDKYENGEFELTDVKTQIEAGWYDWFCKDSSLVKKTERIGHIIQQLSGEGKISLNENYVWFKNNCPLNGPLYDDFRFADIETGEVQMTIQLDCCWNKHKYVVWGRRAPDKEFEHEKPLFETDSVKELVNWLNTPWEA